MKSRRFKVLYITEEDIIGLFFRPVVRGTVIHQVYFEDLPVGTEVVWVERAECRHGFAVYVTHPSFEEVELGAMPPIVHSTHRTRTLFASKWR